MERKILVTTKYKINLDNQTSFYDFGTITEFYQPLIGMSGTSFYLTLFNEKKDNLNIDMLNPHSRLLALTQLNQNDFLAELTKLESYGLIKTFISKIGKKEIYTYVLLPPRAKKNLLEDKNFLDLLKFKLDKVDYEIIFDKWKKSDKDIGIEITQEININYDLNSDIGEKIDISFDTYLFQDFLDQYKISIDDFKPNELDRIINLFGIYNIQYYELASFISKAWINKRFDLKLFEKKLLAFINNKKKNPDEIELFRSKYRSNKLLSEKISLFSKLSNLKYFEELYNRKATLEEIKFLKDLNLVKKIPSPIINVLLDYSYFKNNKFVINYISKISDTFVEKDIKNIVDAFYHLKNAYGADKIIKDSKEASVKKSSNEINTNDELTDEDKKMWEEFMNNEW